MNNSKSIPESRHFYLERLADGVYAAIHKGGGWAICNAGIIDLGSEVLVVDTFLTPPAAYDLRFVAETLSGKPVRKVVNTHGHNDHIWGNQVFDPCTDIISTEKALKTIKESGNPFDQTFHKNAKEQLFALQDEHKKTSDENRRNEISFWLPYYQGLVESLPLFRLRIPNITFSERMVIQGSKRHVELLTFGKGHSDGDAVLYLPQEKIIFMGDLLFVKVHPYMGDGDPDGWMHALDKLKEFELDYIIPGHGPIGTKEDIQLLQEYIIFVKNAVQGVIKRRKGEKGLKDVSIPDKYDRWELPSFFDLNLAFLYQMLSEQ